MRAFTRAVSPRIAECQLTHLERVPIDVAKAAAQHAAYEAALSAAGFDVIRLPELADDPDAVFVEDTAILLDKHAIITRPGAASRIGETASTEAGLANHFEVHRIENGFLDGGDVMRIGKILYVGLSTRTDALGISSLQNIASALGYEVIHAELRDCLHLKTGVTFPGIDAAGRPLLLYDPRSVDSAQFADVEPLAVADGERAAANCLRANRRLILPAGNPRTADRLRAKGFDVVELDVSELQKAEAGVTCMSLIDG
ncbi:dimethylarginine dimethylaminohydrolase family protein [Sphingomonas hankyongi]|uniref:Arginine deiminase family protein n=1 Tax=Sphingomonas hankyongi TaxID=2908209 RepID=A0ABT0S175_9SPHN|nr:arginine deiminase family protein [Sphingomonas hankyongi]MCL6729403.1 arginine deiminase family protein [Sphingomonas hankyongi]